MPAFAYLDHNATSPLRPAALDVMVEALRAGGNPSSVHRAGRAARARLDTARRQIETNGLEAAELDLVEADVFEHLRASQVVQACLDGAVRAG